MSTVTTQINGSLANYIVSDLFAQWESDRADMLEDKWNRNLSAMKCEDWDLRDSFKDSEKDADWKSHTYIPVTRQKVVSAYSLILDMIMQGGEIPFQLVKSPWDKIQWKDLPEDVKDKLNDNMSDMEDLIKQQLQESKATIALMQNIMSMAIYGGTYAKRVISEVERKSFKEIYDVKTKELVDIEPVTEKYLIPDWDFVSIWDIYTDLENKDLHKGIGIIHRQFLSPHDLRQMIGKPHYDAEAIMDVIESVDNTNTAADSTNTNSLPPNLRNLSNRKNTINYLEFWGRVPKKYVCDYLLEREGDEDLQARYNQLYGDDSQHAGDEVEVLCCVANGTVVRFLPMKSAADRPFFYAPWEINVDTLAPEGIADKMTELQAVLNGAVRTFEDNKKLTGNMMIAVKEELLDTPLDKLKPGERIQISSECDDIRQAIMNIQFPDIGESLLSLIGLMDRYIEENSMVPHISQGLSSKTQETAYEISQQLEGSGKYNSGVIRNLDMYLIEPMVTEYYRYNMLNPELPIEKGHYQVKAMGYATYHNKIVKIQKMQQFLQLLATNEALAQKFDIGEVGEKVAQLMNIDIEQFKYSDEELQQQAQQQQLSQQQQQALMQAELGMKQSEIEKDKAYAEAQRLNSAVKLEELKMTKAESAIKLKEQVNEKILSDLEAKGVPRDQVKIEPVEPENGNEPTGIATNGQQQQGIVQETQAGV